MSADLDAGLDASASSALDAELSSSLAARHRSLFPVSAAIATTVAAALVALGVLLRRLRST